MLEQGAKLPSKQPLQDLEKCGDMSFALEIHPAGGREAKILREHIFSVFPRWDCSIHRPVVSESSLILSSISCLNFADFGTCLEGGDIPTFYVAP